MIYFGRKMVCMRMINGQMIYDEQDIYRMLYVLQNINNGLRCQIVNYIIDNDYGIDTRPLVNVVSDPLEFNIDYLYSLDSDVTEKFICIMEMFGIAYQCV